MVHAVSKIEYHCSN